MKQSLNAEKLKEDFLEMVKNAKEPTCPDFLNDDRLEDAFKQPVCDQDGYAESIPTIWEDYKYMIDSDGIKIISAPSALIKSKLYSKYLDVRSLVWDSAKEELFLYVPDLQQPKVAFKGGRWIYAKTLKPEFVDLSLKDIYKEKIGSKP